jgi:hypothetical protein
MTSSLTAPFKTKPQGGATELLSAGARHSRSRCCLRAAVVLSRGIRRQSFQTRPRVRPELLLASASAQNTREWQGLPPPSHPADSDTKLPCRRQDSSHTQSTTAPRLLWERTGTLGQSTLTRSRQVGELPCRIGLHLVGVCSVSGRRPDRMIEARCDTPAPHSAPSLSHCSRSARSRTGRPGYPNYRRPATGTKPPAGNGQ